MVLSNHGGFVLTWGVDGGTPISGGRQRMVVRDADTGTVPEARGLALSQSGPCPLSRWSLVACLHLAGCSGPANSPVPMATTGPTGSLRPAGRTWSTTVPDIVSIICNTIRLPILVACLSIIRGKIHNYCLLVDAPRIRKSNVNGFAQMGLPICGLSGSK